MGYREVVRAHIKLAKCSSKVDKSSKVDNQRIASNTPIYKNNRGYPRVASIVMPICGLWY